MTRFLLLTCGLALTLSASACDEEDGGCRDGDCIVNTPPTSPVPDDEQPDRCAQACANVLGVCATASAKDDDIGQCQEDCRIVFSADEVRCLAELSCGEPTEVCYE